MPIASLFLAALLTQAAPAPETPAAGALPPAPPAAADASGDGPVQAVPLALFGGELPLPFAYRIRRETIEADAVGSLDVTQIVDVVAADGPHAGETLTVSIDYLRRQNVRDGMVTGAIDRVLAEMKSSGRLVASEETRTRGLRMVVADARPEEDDEKSRDKRYVHFVLDVDNGLLVGLLVGKDGPGASAALMGIAKEFAVTPDAQARFEAVAAQVPQPPSGGPLDLPIGQLALLEKFEVGPGMETVVRDGRGRIRAVKRTFVLERPGVFALPKMVAVAASCGTLEGVDEEARALMRNPYLEPESREDVRILATGDTTFASRPGRWVQFIDGVAEGRMHGSYWYAESDGQFLTARLWQNVKKAEVREYEAQMPGLPGRCELASNVQGLVR